MPECPACHWRTPLPGGGSKNIVMNAGGPGGGVELPEVPLGSAASASSLGLAISSGCTILRPRIRSPTIIELGPVSRRRATRPARLTASCPTAMAHGPSTVTTASRQGQRWKGAVQRLRSMRNRDCPMRRSVRHFAAGRVPSVRADWQSIARSYGYNGSTQGGYRR